MFYCSWNGLWYQSNLEMRLFCRTCLARLFKGRRRRSLEIHPTHVHGHTRAGDREPWMPMCCVIMRRACCVFAGCAFLHSHSHLTGDLGLYCYSLVDRGEQTAVRPPPSYLRVTQTSSGMLAAFLSARTVISPSCFKSASRAGRSDSSLGR